MTGPLRNLHDRLCAALPGLVDDVLSGTFRTKAKGDGGLDFVTSIDLELQERLTRLLPDLLPGSLVTGEEGYADISGDEGPVWLVDPLDGTVNFVAGLPCYAVAIVLIEAGRPVLAAVHDAPQGQTYSAIAKGGAFIDGAALQRRSHPARLAVLSSGLMADLAQNAPDALVTLLGDFKLRNLGSQALHLCHVAAGHLSLVASREAKGWDDLAGALIAREAGLVYDNYHGVDPAIADDQYSLCADPETFNANRALLGRSVARPPSK